MQRYPGAGGFLGLSPALPACSIRKTSCSFVWDVAQPAGWCLQGGPGCVLVPRIPGLKCLDLGHMVLRAVWLAGEGGRESGGSEAPEGFTPSSSPRKSPGQPPRGPGDPRPPLPSPGPPWKVCQVDRCHRCLLLLPPTQDMGCSSRQGILTPIQKTCWLVI